MKSPAQARPHSNAFESASSTLRPRRTLGLLVDWLKEFYQNAVFASVAAAAEEADANLLVVTGGILESGETRWSQRNVLYEQVNRNNVDALIITAGTMGNLMGAARLTQYLSRYREIPLISTAYELPDYPSVVVNNSAGMCSLMEHVVAQHGKRRVVFLRGPAGNQEAEIRYRAYRDVLVAHGLSFDPELVYDGDFTQAAGVAGITWLLARGVKFDAVVGANDLMALAAMETLKEHQIKVPRDVIVTGFDDTEESRFAIPQLTTVRQPFRALGREAVRMALALLDGHAVPARVALESELVVRCSCGCTYDSVVRVERDLDFTTMAAPNSNAVERARACYRALKDTDLVLGEKTWLELCSVYFAELEGEAAVSFPTYLVEQAQRSGGDDFSSWYRIVESITHCALEGTVADVHLRLKIKELRQQAHLAMADAAESIQGRKRLRLGRLASALSESSQALTATFDEEMLQNVLIRSLPKLEIPGAIVSLREATPVAGSEPQFRVACQVGNPRFLATAHTHFRASELIPKGLWDATERLTLVVLPLFFEREQFGHIGLVVGPPEGLIYEALRDQVSGALKGGALMDGIVREARLRREAEDEQMSKELKIAARIQTMILPRGSDVSGLELAHVMAPAVNVGGDYYDILPVDGGCWIGIGDVAGHGLGSGLIMMMMQSMVSALVRMTPKGAPSEIARVVNSALYENIRVRLGQDEHATFCLLRYYEDGRLVCTGAHEDILIYRASSGRCDEIRLDGVWVGILPEFGDLEHEQVLRLFEGDIVLLYTDGVTEARDVNGRMFGIGRLKEELAKVHRLSAEAICGHLLTKVKDFMSLQHDDISLLIARYHGVHEKR